MFGHPLECSCKRCCTQVLGAWFDEVGRKTESGGWDCFVTITYRTPWHPWRSGFPLSVSSRPSPEFGIHLFESFVGQIEAGLGARVEYVVVDQYGKLNGRFHQHALLAAPGLEHYPRHEMEAWLIGNAGYSRVLPFKRGAAYYLARFAGCDLQAADWKVRLGEDGMRLDAEPKRGIVVACSAEVPGRLFHQCLPRRRR